MCDMTNAFKTPFLVIATILVICLDHVTSLQFTDQGSVPDAKPKTRSTHAHKMHTSKNHNSNHNRHHNTSNNRDMAPIMLPSRMNLTTDLTAHKTCTCMQPPRSQQPPQVQRQFRAILVVVCEKETGKLIASMKCNRQLVDRVIVVTSQQDVKTVKFCQDAGIECHVTDALHRHNDSFNKGRALREVQEDLHKRSENINSAILLVDADICLPPNMWSLWPPMLQKKTLYTTVSRCMYPSPRAFTSGWPALQGQWLKRTLGMFQAYTWDHNAPLYSDDSPTASKSDYWFANEFKNIESLPMYVNHMGISVDNGRDWNGYKGNADKWAYSTPPPFGSCPCCEFEEP